MNTTTFLLAALDELSDRLDAAKTNPVRLSLDERETVAAAAACIRRLEKYANLHDELVAALEQVARLSATADRALVDVPAMLGDIARAAIAKAKEGA